MTSREEIDFDAVGRRLAERTTKAQGLPLTLSNPETLRRIGVLMQPEKKRRAS